MFRNLLIRVFEGADSDFVFYVGSSSDRGDHRFPSNAGGSVLPTKFANPAIRRGHASDQRVTSFDAFLGFLPSALLPPASVRVSSE
jgi:hypothetical protein